MQPELDVTLGKLFFSRRKKVHDDSDDTNTFSLIQWKSIGTSVYSNMKPKRVRESNDFNHSISFTILLHFSSSPFCVVLHLAFTFTISTIPSPSISHAPSFSPLYSFTAVFYVCAGLHCGSQRDCRLSSLLHCYSIWLYIFLSQRDVNRERDKNTEKDMQVL